MRRKAAVLVVGAGILVGGGDVLAETEMTVGRLRCEYLENPLGIDTERPRLSWIVESPRRGERQTAYQILVASTEEVLARDEGDLWDSGKVETSQTAQIAYGGEVLRSRQRCAWKVRAWDRDGRPTSYSDPARWEMGILKETEWNGEWIGTRRDILPMTSLEGAAWITPPDSSLEHADSSPATTLTKSFEIPGDRPIQTARLRLAGHCGATVLWDDKEVGNCSGDWTVPHCLDLKSLATPGEHRLTLRAEDGTTTPAPLIARLEIIFESGGALRVPTDASWTCPGVADGETTSLPVREVAKWGETPWERPGQADGRVNAAPAPLLRKTFDLDGEVESARVAICGLGYAELHVNGQKVGDALLDPAYTAFDRRALYRVHDITSLLRPGKNALGVMLGTGWFDVHTLSEWHFDSAPWRQTPRVVADVRVQLKDGRTMNLGTDGTWKVSTGPITFDSIYEGESYDARLEKQGWDTAEYDDSSWESAALVERPAGTLRAQQMPPIRATRVLHARSVSEPKPGVFVYDMGQNMAGVPEITVTGDAGTTLSLKCGERLHPDGTVDQHEIANFTVQRDRRQRFQTDCYTLKGGGPETWSPRFTYHGYQYVELTGLSAPIPPSDLKGLVLHTDFEPAGSFTCSDPLLNKIEQATIWAYIGNAHGIPTDCPTREKNGWTADAHLATELGIYHFDTAAFYTKWMNDLADAQKNNGDLPGIVPSGGWGYGIGIGPAWDSAYHLIPWCLYQYYGDRRILETHYKNLRKYVDFLTTRAEGGLVTYGLGDWVAFDTKTPNTLTSTGYYFKDAQIVSAIAGMLGRADDQKKYADLAESIRKAFNARFYNAETGSYDNGSQTALSCALYQGLVEPENRARVLENLVKAVEARNYHIDTGILGSKYVLNALLDGGRADLVYRMVTKRTLPSWGHWIEQGATTLWEMWPGTDSRNHVMFGEVSAWFFRALAGIQVEEPGFSRFGLRPQVVGDLTSARAEYQSIAGLIRSGWTRDGDQLVYDATVPANTVATLYLPTSDATKVTESGRPPREADGVRVLGEETGAAVFELGSGTYRFTAPLERTGGENAESGAEKPTTAGEQE